MATGLCQACGTLNPARSTYCGACGSRFPAELPARTIGRYTGLRFQIDPLRPPPTRDVRWVGFVLGLCSAIVGGFLLVVDVIVTAATSGGGGACASGASNASCGAPLFQYAFLFPGLALLAIGVILAVAAFLATTRNAPGL
jgi:hypothetical protein